MRRLRLVSTLCGRMSSPGQALCLTRRTGRTMLAVVGGTTRSSRRTARRRRTSRLACPAQPNAFVAADGFLHITARRNAAGEWTSARMVSKGLQSFQYGRIEARIKIPAGPGVWPAFWMMGDDSSTNYWPGCGELDIMENIGGEPADDPWFDPWAGHDGDVAG